MRFIIFLVLSNLTFNVFAQEGDFIGSISSNGEPLEAVTIILENSTNKKWTTSDKKGQFQLKLPSGVYNININSLGFHPIAEKIIIQPHETIQKHFELKEDVLGIDEVVITATKTALNRKETPVLVSVTNQKDLLNVKAITLMEGLVFQPGLRTEVNCQNCGFSQVRINGLEGAYSQILIDSRPIFGSLNGIYGLEQIPASMIERIEVIRGGGSAIFGSNAIGGTINIITKNPTKNEAQTSVLHSWIDGNTSDILASANGALVSDNYMKGISFYGIHRNRDAYDANQDGFSEITQLKNINIGTKFFNDFSARHKFVGEVNIGYENRRGGNKFDQPEHLADIAESIKTNMVSANATYDYFSKTYKNKYSAFASGQQTKADNYYGTYDTDLNSYDLEGLNYGHTSEKIYIFGGQHTVFFNTDNGNLQWTSGLEYKLDDTSEERRNPAILPIYQKQDIFGVYTQSDWKISPKIKFLTGIRLDYVNSNMLKKSITVLNPRASFLYNFTKEFIARGSYARGFRAPLFYSEDVHSELITGEVRRVKLADNLKKETSDSFTASVEYNHSHQGHQLVAMIEGFYTILRNPFHYVSVGKDNDLDIKEKKNGDNATVKGLNFELKYAPNNQWILQAGATIQQSEYQSAQIVAQDDAGRVIAQSSKLLRSPNAYGNLTLTYSPSEPWLITLTSVYTGKMPIYHETVQQLKTTPNMVDFGVNTSYNLTLDNFFSMEISAGIKNLFNAYQKDFDKGISRDSNYIYGPALPRTYLLGLKILL